MSHPVINIRDHSRNLVYRGFSDFAAKRLGMSEDSLLDYLLVKGYLITKKYIITFASSRA